MDATTRAFAQQVLADNAELDQRRAHLERVVATTFELVLVMRQAAEAEGVDWGLPPFEGQEILAMLEAATTTLRARLPQPAPERTNGHSKRVAVGAGKGVSGDE